MVGLHRKWEFQDPKIGGTYHIPGLFLEGYGSGDIPPSHMA